MFLTSISPKSECSNSFLNLFCLLSFTSSTFFGLEETNFLISSSVTLPSFSLPFTWLISTPSSLANFRAFGLADEISVTLLWLIEVFWILGFISWIFLKSFSIDVFSWTFSVPSVSASKINIKSPSETLSPTLILTDLIFPSNVAGISTLDLSLSIVISGSFFDIDWPFYTSTSITSTSLNSPMFGTLISLSLIIITLWALVYFHQYYTS